MSEEKYVEREKKEHLYAEVNVDGVTVRAWFYGETGDATVKAGFGLDGGYRVEYVPVKWLRRLAAVALEMADAVDGVPAQGEFKCAGCGKEGPPLKDTPFKTDSMPPIRECPSPLCPECYGRSYAQGDGVPVPSKPQGCGLCVRCVDCNKEGHITEAEFKTNSIPAGWARPGPQCPECYNNPPVKPIPPVA